MVGSVFKGHFSGEGKKFAIVVGRFNELISNKLLSAAVDCFKRHGCSENDIDVIWVPGAFEIPLAAQELAKTQHYDGVVCLGAVIRGATAHFEYISSEVAKGIAKIGLDTGIPIIFGVLTTDSFEQAMERSGGKHGNKGWDGAMAAIETVNLLEKIKGPS